jgi:Ca2+/H+ antiporter
VDGTNIFFINLLGVVLFVIFDYWILSHTLGIETWLTNPGLIFILALLSIIPLAYFIGQAVASISAQSSMGLGAAINAFFSTIVEVYLYCVALGEGKAQLVEGSVIGSIFAGILFLPGLSMCFGAIKRKTQRFNVKSAGVTSTMLLFAVIAAFGPTLFYQIYGSVSGNNSQIYLSHSNRIFSFSSTSLIVGPVYTQVSERETVVAVTFLRRQPSRISSLSRPFSLIPGFRHCFSSCHTLSAFGLLSEPMRHSSGLQKPMKRR